MATADTGAPADTSSTPDVSADANTSGCSPSTAVGLARCVEQARYTADLTTIAVPRSPGTPGHTAARELCAARFAAYGFTVEQHTYATGTNIVGTKLGTTTPNERVIISAHYDAVPANDCPGADDNATGVAGTLEAARVLATGSFARTLVVACWDDEEEGLVGSKAYAARAQTNGETIVSAIVFEMIGFATTAPGSQRLPFGFDLLFPPERKALEANQDRGDFIAVVANTATMPIAKAFATHAANVSLPTVTLEVTPQKDPYAGDLKRSDHGAFWEKSYPALMLTDTAEFRNARYHCPADLADTRDALDDTFATHVVSAAVGAAADTLGVQ